MAPKARLFSFLLLSILITSNCFPDQASADREKEFINRIQNLENAIYQNTQNSTLEKELAQAYLDYGSFLTEEKRFKEARDYVGMAKGLGADSFQTNDLKVKLEGESGSSVLVAREENMDKAIPLPEAKNLDEFLTSKTIVYHLFGEGIKAYKDKNYALAEEHMKRVLEHEKGNKYAHELLGDTYYQTQNLQKAKFHWKRAMTSENMARVRQKLDKVSKEIPLESGLKTTEGEHFIVRYDESQKEYSSYQLKEILREAYRDIYQDFSVPFSGKIVVLLYDRNVFDKSVKPMHWSGAFFDGKIRIPFSSDNENNLEKNRELKRLVLHELSHVFVYEVGGREIPLWLQEGIAQYEENKIVQISLIPFKKALSRNETYTLRQLEQGEALFKDNQSIVVFYQQSFLFVKFLVKQYGFFKLREILKTMKGDEKFDSAIDLVLNISPGELEQQWKSWLKTNL